MGIASITINNLTVFDKLDINFVKGINVFVGDNGTGKTHLLKFMYAFCETINAMNINADNEQLIYKDMMEKYLKYFKIHMTFKLADCFPLKHGSDLMRCKDKSSGITVNLHNHMEFVPFYEIDHSSEMFRAESTIVESKAGAANLVQSVFIPAKEMLTHVGLEGDYKDRRLPFDITLIDIIEKSKLSELRSLPTVMEDVNIKIKNIIGGKTTYDKTAFFIKRGETSRSFQVEAEGYKKFALLGRLIETGKITKDSIIFWDEPEANINPRNIPKLVDIMFDLQKIGVQIFLATHDYLITKYIESRMDKELNNVLFHSLYREEPDNTESPVLVESGTEFSSLEHNDIVLQPILLYKEILEKGMD